MKRISFYMGASHKVVHLFRFSTRYAFAPYKLEAEIKRRAEGTQRYLCRYIEVSSLQISGTSDEKAAFQITTPHLDMIPKILEIVCEIENDVEQALEVRRLRGLLDEEEA